MILYHGKPVHTYCIPGTPTAWARPGTNRQRFYDTQKSLKSLWAISLENQKEDQPFYTKTPLLLVARFYYRPPLHLKPHSKQELLLSPYNHRADLDNLIKLILDTANCVLFDDDSCIVSIHASKVYHPHERTEFALIPLSKEDFAHLAQEQEDE